MKAQEYNRTYNIPFYFNDLLKLIKSLPIQDKLKIEKELEIETLLYRSKKLSKKSKIIHLTWKILLPKLPNTGNLKNR